MIARGKALPKILKAMYVCPEWTVSDIMRLSETQNRTWIHRVVQRLSAADYIAQRSRRRTITGTAWGRSSYERVYRLVDRERFRREML